MALDMSRFFSDDSVPKRCKFCTTAAEAMTNVARHAKRDEVPNILPN